MQTNKYFDINMTEQNNLDNINISKAQKSNSKKLFHQNTGL